MESDFYECPPRSVFDDENGEFCLWLLVHMSKMAAAHSMPQVNKNLSYMFFIISKWFPWLRWNIHCTCIQVSRMNWIKCVCECCVDFNWELMFNQVELLILYVSVNFNVWKKCRWIFQNFDLKVTEIASTVVKFCLSKVNLYRWMSISVEERILSCI